MDYMPQLSATIGLKNCTVIPDELKLNYGPVTAIVWGELFRFSQMYNSDCKASLDTLAKFSGLSKHSVLNHLKILCENGYAQDMTPGLKNTPHTYRLTSKIRVKMEISEPKYEISDAEISNMME